MRAGIADALRAFPRRATAGSGLPAAVAVTLVEDAEGQVCFLLTRRAATLRNHAGQYALPGGRLDPGEDAPLAARRELEEELGIAVPASGVLGLLDDYPTRSGFTITPVVLWAGAAVDRLNPNAAEVAKVFVVPLAELDVRPRFSFIPESSAPMIQLPIMEHLVHAPTAAVLYQFCEVALHGRVTRVAHLEQPVFAWR